MATKTEVVLEESKKEVQSVRSNKGPKRSSKTIEERGIMSYTSVPKKRRRQNWRPLNSTKNSQPERKCHLNGYPITLRLCRSYVMLQIQEFTNLTFNSLPMKLSLEELQSNVQSYVKARRPQMTSEAKAWRHEFLSWKSFKHFLENNLHDLCLKFILRTYVPHDDIEAKFGGTMGAKEAPATFLGSESDFIKIAGVTIPFMVKCGKIYFDLFPAFTILGQLQVALKSDWKEIDTFLLSKNFNLRTVFRINSTDNSYKTWRSQRSAIEYEAWKALILSPLMPRSLQGERKTRLAMILEHLDTDMMGLTRAREDMVEQIEAVVQEHLKESVPIMQDVFTKEKILWGTQVCYRGCGKYYHYSVKCCDQIHTMKYGDFEANYVVVQDQIFLDKCATFALMKKINIVRSGDYRSVDKFLRERHLESTEHFLTESHGNQRRTHLSFRLFQMLAESSDFVEDKETEKEVNSFLEYIISKMEVLKSKCLKYDSKVFKNFVAVEEWNQEQESSSSGIESGGDSSSGKCSPVAVLDQGPDTVQDQDEEPSAKFTEKVLDFQIRMINDVGHLYADLRDLQPLIGLEYDEMMKLLKRRYRSVDVDNSFPCKKFNRDLKFCFSLKCFNLMLAKNYIKVKKGLDKNAIVKEFDGLLAKVVNNKDDDFNDDDIEVVLEDEHVHVEEFDKSQNFVQIGDSNILFLATGRDLFLERKPLMRRYYSLSQCSNFVKMDEILQEADLSPKTAFLYRGRARSFISVQGFKILINSDYYDLKEKKSEVEQSLEKVSQEKAVLMAKKVLHLPTFDAIIYKISKGKVFVNTLQFLKAAGCSPNYLNRDPSKAYFVALRILRRMGMDVKGCFLKQGVTKYGYISLKGASMLTRSESGPFRNKKRMRTLNAELKNAVKNLPSNKKVKNEGQKETSNEEVNVVADLVTLGDLKVKYQIKDHCVYFHRMTIFENIGLEKALLQQWRGLPAVNRILTNHKMEMSKCYLKSPDEQYGYISFPALWTILDTEDPITNMLERRITLNSDLLTLVTKALDRTMKGRGDLFSAIPWRMQNGKFMVHKAKMLAFSGLYGKASILSSFGDFISLDIMLKFLRLDSYEKRSIGYSNLIWTDMISAVMHETPKLRIHVKTIEFRRKLMTFLTEELLVYLGKPDSITSEPPCNIKVKVDLEAEAETSGVGTETEGYEESEFEEADTKDEEYGKTEFIEQIHEEPPQDPGEAMTIIEFGQLEENIGKVRSGIIGDWHVKRCDSTEIRLIVNPGYGASKKISFVQPDVSAILKYELILRPLEPVVLTVNDLKVPHHMVEPIFKKEAESGIYGLLYNLLTLRPCFGNFQPELVETLEKRARVKHNQDLEVKDLVIDTNFIGSSQNGRTYAGTVRSKRCTVLAQSKVSDTCTSCSSLQCVMINRSVLSPKKSQRSLSDESSTSTSSNSSTSAAQVQSVWKVEESSAEGCTFLCPQLQSYNTSLPHQFVSASQASSVVDHRVSIGNDLSLKVSLNKKVIVGKTFADFEKNKQVGPLLESVASMRMCVGYPDPNLILEAKFLMQYKAVLPNEIKKFFNYIMVDEEFKGKMSSSSQNPDLKGTMRANSCRFLASDHADICDQCRLLQEPLNFLGL